MAQPREVFGTTVPGWIKERVIRWKRIFNLNDWVLRARMIHSDVAVDDDGNSVDAHTTTNAPYKYANIYVGEHVKDEPEGHAILFHEIRHVVYEQYLNKMLERDVISRFVPEDQRKFVRKQIDDAVEALIENDVYVFEQLTELWFASTSLPDVVVSTAAQLLW